MKGWRGLAVTAGLMTTLLSWSGAYGKSWLCIAENAGGLKWVDGNWKGTAFTAPGKYIIKPIDLTDVSIRSEFGFAMEHNVDEEKIKYRYQLQAMGENYGRVNFCKDYETSQLRNFLICKDNFQTDLATDEFQVDLQTMHFQAIRPGTIAFKYDYNRRPELNDDAVIEQGVCSQL